MSDEVNVREQLIRMEGKLDAIVLQHSTFTQSSERVSGDHETRLRALEKGRWPLPSLAALVALASLILAILSFTKGG
ncbi:hypothetical protein ACFSKW_54940 [Nonomuraea mangrovi]|uniref:DUF3618 domain-containing protein n=1 Tax=Nonomuraea mangrovi TaxID=2316207 RepID=A0ABW4TI11_9ACTN